MKIEDSSYFNKDYSTNKELIQMKLENMNQYYSKEFMEMVIRMLTIDPKFRIPIDEVIELTSPQNEPSTPLLPGAQQVTQQENQQKNENIARNKGIEFVNTNIITKESYVDANQILIQGFQPSNNSSNNIDKGGNRNMNYGSGNQRQGIEQQMNGNVQPNNISFKRNNSNTHLFDENIMRKVQSRENSQATSRRQSIEHSPSFALGTYNRQESIDQQVSERSMNDNPLKSNTKYTRISMGKRDRSKSPLLKPYGSQISQDDPLNTTTIDKNNPSTSITTNIVSSFEPQSLRNHPQSSSQDGVSMNLNHVFSKIPSGSHTNPNPKPPIPTTPPPPRSVSPIQQRSNSQAFLPPTSYVPQHNIRSSESSHTNTIQPIVIHSNSKYSNIPSCYSHLYDNNRIQIHNNDISYGNNSHHAYGQNNGRSIEINQATNAYGNAGPFLVNREGSLGPTENRFTNKITRYSQNSNGERIIMADNQNQRSNSIMYASRDHGNTSPYANPNLRQSDSSSSYNVQNNGAYRPERESTASGSNKDMIKSSATMRLDESIHNNLAKTPYSNSSNMLPPKVQKAPQKAQSHLPLVTSLNQSSTSLNGHGNSNSVSGISQSSMNLRDGNEGPRLVEKIYTRDPQGNTVEMKTFLETDGTRRTEKRVCIDSKGQLFGKFKETGVDLNDVIVADPNLLKSIIEEQVRMRSGMKEVNRVVVESSDKPQNKAREIHAVKEPAIEAISESPIRKSVLVDSDEKLKKIEVKKEEDSAMKSVKKNPIRNSSPDIILPGWQRIASDKKQEFDGNMRAEETGSLRPSFNNDHLAEKENINTMESVRPSSLYYTESPMKSGNNRSPTPTKQQNQSKPFINHQSNDINLPQPVSEKKSSDILAGIKGKKIKVRYKDHKGQSYPVGITGCELTKEEKDWLLRRIIEKEGYTMEEIEALEGGKLQEIEDNGSAYKLTSEKNNQEEDVHSNFRNLNRSSNLVKDIQNQIIKEQDEELVSQSSAYPSQRKIHNFEEATGMNSASRYEMSRPHESENAKNDDFQFRTKEQKVLDDMDAMKYIDMSKSSKKRFPNTIHSEKNGLVVVEVDKNDPALNYESRDMASDSIPKFNYDTETGYNPGFRQSFGTGNKGKESLRAEEEEERAEEEGFDPSDIDALLRHNESLLSKIKMDMKNIGDNMGGASQMSNSKQGRQSGIGGNRYNHEYETKDNINRSPIGLQEFESFKTKNNEVG